MPGTHHVYEHRCFWADGPDLPPVRYVFLVDVVPAGEAPLDVRGAWVGLALPVRRDRPVEGPYPIESAGVETAEPEFVADAVIVAFRDCMTALTASGRSGAAAYWETWQTTAHSCSLAFRTNEGRLLPAATARRLFPDIPAYD